MKSFTVFAVSMCIIQGSLALNCYQCSYDPRFPTDNEDNNPGCADNGDDIDKTQFSRECKAGDNYDICFFRFTVDEDDNEIYHRGCGWSKNYNDEDDKCESWSAFDVDYNVCVCDTTECNSSSFVKASFVLIVSAFFKQFVL